MRTSLALIGTMLFAGCTAPQLSTSGGAAAGSSLSADSADPSALQFLHWTDELNVTPTTAIAQPSQNYDANNCELYVSDIGKGDLSHDGSSASWIQVYIDTSANQDGQLLDVGMYTATTDGTRALSIGDALSDCATCFETGYTFSRTGLGATDPFTQTLDQYAFFIDVQRPDGTIVRLWQSNGGLNYVDSDVFAGSPSHIDDEGADEIVYANSGSIIFAQKQACGD